MKHGQFLWADLSTFRTAVTQPFYTSVMGWSFDQNGVARTGGRPAALLYEMPEKFQAIGMPSFWMSYIAVDDVAATVEVARAHGGKVELGPAAFEGGGQYALIRDPLGAGFTVYQGTALDGAATGGSARLGHGLFVSDAKAVEGFYTALFGWEFGVMDHGVSAIRANGKTLAHLHEIPDQAVRGKEQYWAVYFGCASLATAKQRVARAGGTVLADLTLPEGPAITVQDPDGGTFFLVSSAQPPAPIPWLAWSGFGLVILSVLTNWAWIWAIFLGVWVFTGLRDRETWLFQRVGRQSEPMLYWAILGLYAALAVVSLFGWQ